MPPQARAEDDAAYGTEAVCILGLAYLHGLTVGTTGLAQL